MIGRYSLADVDPDACRRLWCAVLEQVIHDDDAEYILAAEGEDREDFDFLCTLADVDPDHFRRKFRERQAKLRAIELDERSALFVRLVLDGVAKTTAAKLAGYSSKAAASRLLNKSEVRAAINRGEVPSRDVAA